MTQIKDVISYNEHFLSLDEANEFFDHLMEYDDLTEMMEIKIAASDSFKSNFGKMMFLERETKEEGQFPESIMGKTTIWSKKMFSLKERIENQTNNKFGTCVCVFYPDGNSGVYYHSDKVAFGDTSIIPAISLGEKRLFSFREIITTKETTMMLKHGSLLIMGQGCQENFEHSLPLNTMCKKPRISLTFIN